MWKIIIAESHAAIRNSLRKILGQETDLELIEEATSSYALIRSQALGRADLLLLDISLPGEAVLELLMRIKKNFPSLPVVIMSMMAEPDYESLLLSRGAAALVQKDKLATEAVPAIRSAISGTTLLSPVAEAFS